MSYASIDGLENAAQEAHIEDSIKLQKLKMGANANKTGLCEDCGGKIPEARLKTMPNANCCVQCQEEREGNPQTKITFKNPYMP
jgi:phage/conjugal plasmid C-4 type zinc finger TraR family protein